MTGLLAVVEDVGLASVQDGGRRGLAGVGVPRAGAWHRSRYLTATALVCGAEDPSVPAVELLGGALRLQIHADVIMAVVGPGAWTVDDDVVATGVTFHATPGSIAVIEHRGPGPVYVVVSGWQAPHVLGSASWDSFSMIGGGAMCAGALLAGSAGPVDEALIGSFQRRSSSAQHALRVIVDEELDPRGDLLSGPWSVVTTARSGTRLQGGRFASAPSLPSMPMVVGAIQATPSGEAIILGPEGGLTGGYPVVGVVSSADVDRVSEAIVGSEVRFESIDVLASARLFAAGETSRRGSIVRPGILGSRATGSPTDGST